jgi:hypothetical protein
MTIPGFTAEAAIFEVTYQYWGSATHGSLAGGGTNVQPAQLEANSSCRSGRSLCNCSECCSAGRGSCRCIPCTLPASASELVG